MSIDTPEIKQSEKGNKILDSIKNLFTSIARKNDENRKEILMNGEPVTDTFDRELGINIDTPETSPVEDNASRGTEIKDVNLSDNSDNKETLNRLETPLDIREEEKDLDVSNLSINEDEYLNNDETMKNRIKNIIIIIVVVLVSICALVLIISWITALTKSISNTNVIASTSSTIVTTNSNNSGNVIDENVKVTNGGFDLFGGFFGGSNNQSTKSTTTSKKAYVDRIAEDFSLTGFEKSLVNWDIISQRPTVKADLSQEQYDQSWRNGYLVQISGNFSTDYKNFDYTRGEIIQYADRYPESSMGKLIDLGYKVKDNNLTNCTVSDTKQDLKLNIAHKIYLVDCDNYYNDKYLVAQFYKKDIFETIEFKSSQLDLAFFRRVLVDAIEKID